MNTFRAIREALEVSQAEIGSAIGVTQGNVSFYERGQTIPPDVASRLIAFARERGLALSYDHVYGGAKLPAIKGAPRAPQRA